MMGMKVLSAAEMQACDRVTTERFGVPSIELMRTASAAVAAFAHEHFPKARRITVLCGRGNNGGDGMMAARLLALTGLEVTAVLLGSADDLKGDAATAWLELIEQGAVRTHVAKSAGELEHLNQARGADLFIDAVVGTGFKPPLQELALSALNWIKGTAVPILSVDLPSGWRADAVTATADEAVFPSDAVVTFTAPKAAHVFGNLTRRWDQPIIVAPIGSPQDAIVSSRRLIWAGASHAVVEKPRPADSNKGKYGHVLVIGGSVGKSGAPAMSAMTALRAGAGLVTAAVPKPIVAQVAGFAPELMTVPLQAGVSGELAARKMTAQQFAALLKGKTVIAAGPGLGQGAGTAGIVAAILDRTEIPAVLDADALNTLASDSGLLGKLSKATKKSRTIVLTPHPGEMARLAGVSVKDVQSNRLETARSFVEKHGVTLVLKGARTLIAHPDGNVAVNTTGNPAMAKGGSGDMLTGLIAGLLAQYPAEPARAVEAAVYLHGLAADFAVREVDEHTLLATDTLRFFSQAFRFRLRGPNGYVWLQGLPAVAGQSNEAAG
jgi:ADP-dependent NAD(P)H-hydrate dehydratase / NAD(P)H-hydrate epimerase